MCPPANWFSGQGAGGRQQILPQCFSLAPRSSLLTPPRAHPLRAERGIALLIVVSLLTVIGILGVAFAFSMHLETQATREFVSTTQARYLAEAGVSHARALLDEDHLGSRVDESTEAWAREVSGSDADVDGDQTPDAKWWTVTNANQAVVGRYALKISDEGGKANLNAAQAAPSPLGLGAINLTTLLERVGIGNAAGAARAIEDYRYGPDRRPGVASVDDDGNGTIDDPGEYQPLAPRGDDRTLTSVEDVAAIAGLTKEDIQRLSTVATVYSWDPNVSVTGKTRVNVNTATAGELFAVLLEAGVEDPWQAAVNMADDVDADLEMSTLVKTSQPIMIADQGSSGAWTWSTQPDGHYESHGPGDDTLSWSVAVPTGRFRVLARGINGVKVGDVTVGGQLKHSVDHGESLGIFDLSETLTVNVVNREAQGTACAFRGIELVPETPDPSLGSGVVVRGIEAVRFNELMVDPVMKLPVSSVEGFPPAGWACTGSPSVCSRTGAVQSTLVWDLNNTVLPESQHYYVRVFGRENEPVGQVRIEGVTKFLSHKERHPAVVTLDASKKISLTLGKDDPEKTYYIEHIELSLQPDGEYVELINLSDADIDVSGWTIEGALTGGRRAKLPAKASLKPHGLLVAAVDLDDAQKDAQTSLADNGIDARRAWGIPSTVNAVQLEFPDGIPSPDDDWLKVTLPNGTSHPSLMLRGKEGGIVDEVQYALPLSLTAQFQSVEKGDPTVIVDKNGDGIDDGWFPSLKLYTPGATNDCEGLKVLEGKDHDPGKEITVMNRPLGGVGELAGLPSGKAWKPFSSQDLAKIADRLTVKGVQLEAEGHLIQGQDAWQERSDGSFEYNSTAQPATVGTWQWTGILDGHYRLSIHGWSGEQIAIRWARADGTFPADWSNPPAMDAQGHTFVGQITIGVGETPANTLTLNVECRSTNGICHLDRIQLDPQLIRVGPVNVNTAPVDVLMALPGMTDALAQRIIAGRPYGDQQGKGRGIGDVLSGDVLGSDEETKLATFRKLADLLTTRSDVFEIISLGQTMDHNRSAASQRIRTIVQR